MHLPALLEEYGDQIEADFLDWGIDLLDMYRPGSDLTPYRAVRLIRQLGPASRFVRAAGGEKTQWSTSEYLLAMIADSINLGNWQRTGKRQNKPKPVPRPGEAPKGNVIGGKANRTRSQEEIRDYLDRLKTGSV